MGVKENLTKTPKKKIKAVGQTKFHHRKSKVKVRRKIANKSRALNRRLA